MNINFFDLTPEPVDGILCDKLMSHKQSDTLFISFSGGETSAFMTLWCLKNMAPFYKNTVVLFSNTGQENEETLLFVHNIETYFDIPVVWVESVVHHETRKGCTHRVVDFKSANRDGSVFEEVIKKYGIPNKAYPHCTRELKLNPMKSYMKSLGLKKGEYDTCVGIRVDEIDRISNKARENNIIYPLVSFLPMTKTKVNTFWERQPFRLGLKGYQGNCKWCWKKSNRKHFTLMEESPDIYQFPRDMERKHGLAGVNKDGTHRVFFRQNRSVDDMFLLKDQTQWTPATDDSVVYDEYLDTPNGGCVDSCEIDFTMDDGV